MTVDASCEINNGDVTIAGQNAPGDEPLLKSAG